MRPLYMLIGFFLMQAGWSVAQESFFSNLISHPPEQISLLCQWDSLTTLKDESSWDGKMQLIRGQETSDWEVKLTVRGKFRRAKCSFPPLEINLKKGALRKQGLLEFDRLKLVTHCANENADPLDLYEELLIYQLYALLTPHSFRAQLLKINYLYADGKTFQKNATAILLEPTAELAHRVHGAELEAYGVTEDSLDAASYCRSALFQFMIGNFDWDHAKQRNVKMVGNPGRYHVVPYDFDFSAVVFPSYARMPSDYALTDFRDRIYLGQLFDAQIPMTVKEFLEKKEILLAHVENYSSLSKLRRREIVEYFEKFFEFVGNPEQSITKGTMLPFQE